MRERAVVLGAALVTAAALALDERIEWPWMLLGWVALVPWLAVLDRTRSLREALCSGMLMSLAFILVTFNWFASSIQAYTGAPRGVALLVMALLAPILEPQFITFALARHLARQRTTGRGSGALRQACPEQRRRPQGERKSAMKSGRGSVHAEPVEALGRVLSQRPARRGFWRVAIIGACVYVGTDSVWPKLFGDSLGYGMYPSMWMRQAADLAGVYGLTFVLVLANECMLAIFCALRGPLLTSPVARGDNRGGAVIRDAFAPAACVMASILALLAYGAVRCQEFNAKAASGATVSAGLIQADISQYDRMAAELGTFEAVRLILDAHFALSNEALARAKLDFLVWPETVYPTTFGSPKSAAGADFDRDIAGFVTSTGVPLVFGAYDLEAGDEFNAAMFLQPAEDNSVTFDAYRKASLFPLTERVPALFESGLIRSWLPWLGTWKPGKGPTVLPLTLRGGRTVLVAPLICYDAVDPALAAAAARRGAELIVTLSNDFWFRYGPAPHGHLVYAAFRSIETRRPQLRVTNTGISGVITATGEIVAAAGVHERAALVGTVTLERRAMTLMLAWGQWFGPTALFVGVALLVAQLLGDQWSGRTRSKRDPKRTG
ncbi:MAG: apolipoprotein N-acyltransferase [Candidatus Binatia bacterium]